MMFYILNAYQRYQDTRHTKAKMKAALMNK
jgi:hypothetical protein